FLSGLIFAGASMASDNPADLIRKLIQDGTVGDEQDFIRKLVEWEKNRRYVDVKFSPSRAELQDLADQVSKLTDFDRQKKEALAKLSELKDPERLATGALKKAKEIEADIEKGKQKLATLGQEQKANLEKFKSSFWQHTQGGELARLFQKLAEDLKEKG